MKTKPTLSAGVDKLRRNPRLLVRAALIVAAYLCVFILLDYFSQQFEELRGIVAWYPPAGLTYALLLVLGVRFTPAVTIALFISTLFIYHMPQPPYQLFLWAFIVSSIYGLASAFLRHRIDFDWQLRKRRDVTWLIGTAVLVSALLAVLSVSSSALMSSDVLRSEVLRSIFIWWIGEMVGVLTVTPFLLIYVMPWLKEFSQGHPTRIPARWSFPRPSLSIIGQTLSIALMFYWVFGVHGMDEFRPMYLLTLPLIWIVLEHGLKGTATGIMVLNFGLMLAMWFFRFDLAHLGELQLKMIAICIVGLLMGVVVTERKQAEEALRESEELNRSITEKAADAIITIDEDGLVLSWNQAAKDIFGYSAREMMNMDLKNIIPNPHMGAHRSGIAKLKAGGLASIIGNKVEITAHQKNGSEIPIAMSRSSWTSKGHLHFTGIIRDITNRKKAEADITKSLLEAKAANEVKDQFIANISHEIRTPLNSIIGFSDLFRQRYGDLVNRQDRHIFQYITNSSNRLMRTVDSILNISQLNAGSIKIEQLELDLNHLIRAVIGELEVSAAEKGLELKFSPTDQAALVFVDKNSLHQAILNITENAIKYTREGKIELKLIQKKASFRLSIQDTGIGISAEYQKRIFTPYTQESEGFTKNYQGIGLGLALVKRYLELNDIDLELESKKNVGTTFTLIFPKHAGSDHV